MKIIRSFCLITVCLGTATMLHAQQAQDIKTEIAKPVASTVPPPGAKPALAADVVPAPAAAFREMPKAVVYEAPSPYKRDESQSKVAPAEDKARQITPTPVADIPQAKPQAVLTPAPAVKSKGE